MTILVFVPIRHKRSLEHLSILVVTLSIYLWVLNIYYLISYEIDFSI